MEDGPVTPPLADALDMTLREWIERFQEKIVTRRVSYRGVPAWKTCSIFGLCRKSSTRRSRKW